MLPFLILLPRFLFKPEDVKEAVKDPFTWLFCGMHFALVTAQSFKDFFPSVSLTFRLVLLFLITIARSSKPSASIK